MVVAGCRNMQQCKPVTDVGTRADVGALAFGVHLCNCRGYVWVCAWQWRLVAAAGASYI